MSDRVDPRRVAGEIREALKEYPREALVEILTHVFKEYVVESPPLLTAVEPESLAELSSLSFPELVRTLQLRLDLPELAALEVDGGQVYVRAAGNRRFTLEGGRAVDIGVPAGTAEGAAAPTVSASAPAVPGRVVTPTAGAGAGAARAGAAAPAGAQAQPAQAAGEGKPGEKPGAEEKAKEPREVPKRFKLLEID